MASASMSGAESFLTQVERAREKIGVKFRKAHQVLLDREAYLLSELQQLESRYKGEGVAEQLGEINASKEQLIAIMKGNENQETLKQSVAPLDARMRELEIGLETAKDRLKSVVFEWDGELERMLSETGEIRVRAALDYKKKGEPVKTACKHRKGRTITDGVFHCPSSIELEFNSPTSVSILLVKRRIYICDVENCRIQCLNLDLTFHSFIPTEVRPVRIHCTSDEIIVLKVKSPCLSFYDYSHQLLREIIPIGEGTSLLHPFGFCVDHLNNILFVDYSANCVVIFSNNGELVHKFGQKGEGRGEFIDPTAIALDSEDKIFVASKNPEHCLQLF